VIAIAVVASICKSVTVGTIQQPGVGLGRSIGISLSGRLPLLPAVVAVVVAKPVVAVVTGIGIRSVAVGKVAVAMGPVTVGAVEIPGIGLSFGIGFSFSGSIGLLFLFLACALPQFNNWYPFTVVIFYLLSPLPTLIAKRSADDSSSSNPCRELAWFLTTGIVVSAFALPIVLARAPYTVPVPDPTTTVSTIDTISTTIAPNTTTTTVIEGGACGLVITANSVMFLTILGFFIAFDSEDVEYSVW